MAKFNKTQLDKVGDKITDLLKTEIIRQDLFVTGKMLRDTEVTEIKELRDSNLEFLIESQDYFRYVDNKKQVVEKGLKDTKFKEVLNLMNDLYVGKFEKDI